MFDSQNLLLVCGNDVSSLTRPPEETEMVTHVVTWPHLQAPPPPQTRQEDRGGSLKITQSIRSSHS